MIQNIFWVFCLCLQLMRVQAQLDLPNTSKQPLPKTLNVTPNPQHFQQQQQQPFLNNFVPNYEFGQQQLPYPYNNYIPINNNYQPRPVIQINNRPFPNHDNNNNNTRLVNQLHLFGRLDNNFRPGYFPNNNDYYGHLRPRPQLQPFPQINFVNYPRQNLVTSAQQTVAPPAVNTAQNNVPKPDEAPLAPSGGQIPQPPPLQPSYGGNFGVQGYGGPTPQPGFQLLPNRPGFDPSNPQQQFHQFPLNFGRYDFGYSVAPPQTIEQNLQVTGAPTNQGRGLPPPLTNPVVGFYGPPPNLGVFSYPTFSPGFSYQNGQTNQFVSPDPDSEQVEEQPPEINPK